MWLVVVVVVVVLHLKTGSFIFLGLLLSLTFVATSKQNTRDNRQNSRQVS